MSEPKTDSTEEEKNELYRAVYKTLYQNGNAFYAYHSKTSDMSQYISLAYDPTTWSNS